MNSNDWKQIAQQISTHTGQPFTITSTTPISGGCINEAWHLSSVDRSWFIKLNAVSKQAMLAAEMLSLEKIAETQAIRVPAPLCVGTTGSHSFLVLEYIELVAGHVDSDASFGEQLAGLHHHTGQYFGWSQDNTIGSTAQINTATQGWCDFWREQRLGFQLRLAVANGYQGRLQQRGEKLLGSLTALFSDHQPQPSLVHGDLWSGNYGYTATGDAVIFDPACYYADREVDLAMTELFGGFSTKFYQAYQAAWPLQDGYQVRKQLYNLYHILNHLNLFGGGYLNQSVAMIDGLLAELN